MKPLTGLLVFAAALLGGCGSPAPVQGDNPAASAGRSATPEQLQARSRLMPMLGRDHSKRIGNP